MNNPENTKILPFDDHATIQAEAREWLIRLDRDEPPSRAELSALRQWAGQSDAHHQELVRISALWSDANILNDLSTPVYNRARSTWSGLLANISSSIFSSMSPATRWGSASASLALIFALTLALLPSPIDHSNGLYVTAIGEVQEQLLVDGTVLRLNTDSQIQVDYSENVRRIRLLRGEAHFEVASDKQWPFQVYAGPSMVKAVGTAFSVRLKTDVVKVIVDEGRVDLSSVTTNSDTSAVPARMQKLTSLAIGQSAIVNNSIAAGQSSRQLEQQQLASDEIDRQLAWRTGYLVFAGDSLSHVIQEVSRYTPIEIEIVDPELKQLRVGGRFKVGELEAMFEVLQSSFGIQVSVISDHQIHLRPAQ